MAAASAHFSLLKNHLILSTRGTETLPTYVPRITKTSTILFGFIYNPNIYFFGILEKCNIYQLWRSDSSVKRGGKYEK